MKLKYRRIAVDFLISFLMISAAVTSTILLQNVGVIIAIPMIEAAIYALWHAKNIYFEPPQRPVRYIPNYSLRPRRNITKVPTAKKSMKQEYRNKVWTDEPWLNKFTLFRKNKGRFEQKKIEYTKSKTATQK